MRQKNGSLHSDGFSNRNAFVLNANAKSVTDKIIGKLVDLIPAGDLFYSRSLAESENYYRTILRRGYARVFSGGGDGTVLNAINTIRRLVKNEALGRMPAVGVLKLGTGNAMASVVGAQKAWIDVHHLVRGGSFSSRPINLVECDDGIVAPFAGVGYDGEILNDYFDLKAEHEGKVTAALMNSVFGYVWAGLTRAVPRHMNKKDPWVRVYSSKQAHRIVSRNSQDIEEPIAAGCLLYEGPSCLVSVGAISYFGYGFKMFPLAHAKEGHLHLRICSSGLLPIMTNLYPGIWKGTYRHPDFHELLVQDVTIECDKQMPYQIGGDAAGYRNKLTFKAARNVIDVVELTQERVSTPRGILGLLPAPVFARS